MEQVHLIFNAIDHTIYVCKKKLSVKNILSTISKPSAFHLTAESLQIELNQITTDDLINQNLFPEAYLEPSRTSTMELFCENS